MDFRNKKGYVHTPLRTNVAYSTVRDRLQTFAKVHPSKEACVAYDIDGNRSSISCYDLFQKTCNFAKGLIKLGIKKGDIVGISVPNGPAWMICTFGIQIAGAVPLLFKFYRNDGEDISCALAKSERCTAMIFDPGNHDVNYKISRCFINELNLDGSTKSTKIPSLKFVVLSKKPSLLESAVTIETILHTGQKVVDTYKLPEVDPDDVAAILLTSGSTGTPKAIQYTHLNLLEVGRRHCLDGFAMNVDDVYYNANSFNWGGAYPHMFLFLGTTRVTCSDVLSFRSIKDLDAFIVKVVGQEKCTCAMIGVPSVLEMIENDERSYDWASSLRKVAAAGLPIPSICSKILDKFGEEFIPMYGATEIGSISSLTIRKGDDFEDYVVGIPFSGMEAKSVGKNGEILPVNEFGEIYIRDCIPRLGYLKDENKTKQVFTPTGWYKTDDIGCIKDNGSIIVTGRKSDMLIIGEELVSPSYLERLIRAYEGVRDVVVVPVADDSLYQQACVCIIPSCGAISEESMKENFHKEFSTIAECRGFVPKYYLFFDAFPTTPLGKLSRKRLQQVAMERLGKVSSTSN